MAAAEAGRDMAYFTFGDTALMRDVHDLHKFLTDKHVTVGKNTLVILAAILKQTSFSDVFLKEVYFSLHQIKTHKVQILL